METIKLILTTREPLLVFLVGVVMFLFGATGVLPLYYTTIPIIDSVWRAAVALVGIILIFSSVFFMRRQKTLISKVKDLAGVWEIESISTGSNRNAYSEATISLDDGEFYIAGGIFMDRSKNIAIGSWDVEMAMSDGKKIKFFYYLTDNLLVWKGLVELTLNPCIVPLTFEGTWQVIGKDIHSGTMRMKKIF
ncbi:hypothetical protein LDFHOB_01995 [Candidatus Electronema aureum]